MGLVPTLTQAATRWAFCFCCRSAIALRADGHGRHAREERLGVFPAGQALPQFFLKDQPEQKISGAPVMRLDGGTRAIAAKAPPTYLPQATVEGLQRRVRLTPWQYAAATPARWR